MARCCLTLTTIVPCCPTSNDDGAVLPNNNCVLAAKEPDNICRLAASLPSQTFRLLPALLPRSSSTCVLPCCPAQ
eukprot:146472-Chlamydomonas_euryale.AAC.2